jgi:3-phosphoshikimate 1-carboxyvinyltransferase
MRPRAASVATVVKPAEAALKGRCRVPGDKSISHRAAIVGALATGPSRIEGFSPAEDCLATLAVLLALGVRVRRETIGLIVDGHGSERLRPPDSPLDCVRSGTTMRLMAGVLAGAGIPATLTGDDQLLRRPMDRVAEPLRLMGADVDTAAGGGPPMTLRGRAMHPIEYRLPVASAQVKSAILLAALRIPGTTTVVEPDPTRDHTERILGAAGAVVRVAPGPEGRRVSIDGPVPHLAPLELMVPGDLSSAAPLLAAAALVPGSDLVIDGVGLNPTRTGFLEVLRRMGASLEIDPLDGLADGGTGEPAGRIRIHAGALQPATVSPEEAPRLIDELPLVGLLGTRAEGATRVRGAADLRAKESDRIAGLVSGLRALGADAEELPDGFVVHGPTPLVAGACDARGDHRLAMAFAVAGLIAAGPVAVSDMETVVDSFPGFLATLDRLR